jgi:hypothetical protein
MMKEQQIAKEVAHFKATGKLTSHPQVPCSECGAMTTMFGTNLAGRIHKFGSLANLLSGFQCKACRSAGKPVKVKTVRTKRVKKIVQTANMVWDIPKINLKRQESIVLVDNPEVAAHVLTSCWRPDIYLDNERSCDDCSLYGVCKAACRRLSTDKKRKLAIA